jgi:hypothetical protein
MLSASFVGGLWEVQEKQEVAELNGARQSQVLGIDANLLGEIMHKLLYLL